MARQFVFTSPGVKFRERTLEFVTRRVGLTTLGLVGETTKGAAFEPVLIEDADQFRTRFGVQSIEKFGNGNLKYQLPYVANKYLQESSQLYVTRVLGLSGYDAGTAWAITANGGCDLSTTGVTSSSTTTGNTFTGGTYLGVSITATGQTGVVNTGFTRTSGGTFSLDLITFTADTLSNGSGTTTTLTETITGSSLSEYDNMVLAVIRARGSVTDVTDVTPTTAFDATSLSITSNLTDDGAGDLFANFTIQATSGSSSDSYTASLNPNSREYLPNVIGNKPKGKNTRIWVEAIYPDLIKKLDADGLAYGINTTLVDATSTLFTDYTYQYQTPETPWVVSELRGSDVDRLFKFISISDGDAANQEIKISFTNIDPVTKEFNVIIRDFNDTDQNPIVLESFTRCTMNPDLNNYIGNRIGTSNGDYPLRSEYVMLQIDENAPTDSFPAGFEGYIQPDWAASATSSSGSVEGVAPKIFYKTGYTSSDRVNRTYLGISENAYDGTGLVGNGINRNLFNFIGHDGSNTSSFVKSKGFHLDSGATDTYYDGNTLIGQFEVGAGRFRVAADINSDSDTYGDANSRKFTFVPAGGFDGWNVHRNTRSYGDLYKKGGSFDGVADGLTPVTDYQAWETAIETFSNPEEVTINLLATPGINWSDNLSLVNYTIDMIETDRADSVYIIDAPDIDQGVLTGQKLDETVANDIADLLDATNIDSNYSATYYPWVQVRDTENNRRVYLPPTGDIVKAIAYTDNVKFPWFAVAGLQRGSIDALKAKYRMSQSARDILYQNRLNPIADFVDVGTVIMGQKTLQVKEDALDRLNVRRLLLRAKVIISNIATRLLFEQNDQTTIDQFLSKANPALENIRRERGLESFQIRMDESLNTPETRDRNELYGEIFIKPTKALEFIGITFTVTPSGASFDDI